MCLPTVVIKVLATAAAAHSHCPLLYYHMLYLRPLGSNWISTMSGRPYESYTSLWRHPSLKTNLTMIKYVSFQYKNPSYAPRLCPWPLKRLKYIYFVLFLLLSLHFWATKIFYFISALWAAEFF